MINLRTSIVKLEKYIFFIPCSSSSCLSWKFLGSDCHSGWAVHSEGTPQKVKVLTLPPQSERIKRKINVLIISLINLEWLLLSSPHLCTQPTCSMFKCISWKSNLCVVCGTRLDHILKDVTTGKQQLQKCRVRAVNQSLSKTNYANCRVWLLKCEPELPDSWTEHWHRTHCCFSFLTVSTTRIWFTAALLWGFCSLGYSQSSQNSQNFPDCFVSFA